MEERIEIISKTILEFQDSGRTSNDALARIIIGNLEDNGYELKKLSQHDVIKNEVAVCEHDETENIHCEVGWSIEGKRCKKCKQTVL